MKKLFALALAVAMSALMAVPALAIHLPTVFILAVMWKFMASMIRMA